MIARLERRREPAARAGPGASRSAATSLNAFASWAKIVPARTASTSASNSAGRAGAEPVGGGVEVGDELLIAQFFFDLLRRPAVLGGGELVGGDDRRRWPSSRDHRLDPDDD
jgi:hypothetical protein